MTQNTPTSVVFDIGNVLISWDPRNLYQHHFEDSDELNWFLDEVVTMDWHTKHDAGLPISEGIAQLSKKHPKYAAKISLFDIHWRKTIMGEISGSVEILKKLKAKGIPLFAITNYSKEKFPELVQEFDFVDCFKDIVISGEEGIVKPDPKIYQIAKERFGLRDGEALFVDDREENINVAVQEGFLGHHFKGPDILHTALIKLGLF